MAEFPAMPLWTDAYLADTTHLTTLEHGAYLLLLMAMWRTHEKSLPDDDRKLARFAKLTPGQWRRIKPTMMDFFIVENGMITQGRLTDEAIAVRQHRARQSDKAKRRWLKHKESLNAAAKPERCPTDASLTHTHIDSESERRARESTKPSPPKNGAAGAAANAAPKDLDALLFERGKALLGKNAGGQIRKLRDLVGTGSALTIIEAAARKQDPAEYVAAAIKNHTKAPLPAWSTL